MDKAFQEMLESLYHPNPYNKTQAYLFEENRKTISRNNTIKQLSLLLWRKSGHWSHSSLSENECIDEYIYHTHPSLSREKRKFLPMWTFISLPLIVNNESCLSIVVTDNSYDYFSTLIFTSQHDVNKFWHNKLSSRIFSTDLFFHRQQKKTSMKQFHLSFDIYNHYKLRSIKLNRDFHHLQQFNSWSAVHMQWSQLEKYFTLIGLYTNNEKLNRFIQSSFWIEFRFVGNVNFELMLKRNEPKRIMSACLILKKFMFSNNKSVSSIYFECRSSISN